MLFLTSDKKRQEEWAKQQQSYLKQLQESGEIISRQTLESLRNEKILLQAQANVEHKMQDLSGV